MMEAGCSISVSSEVRVCAHGLGVHGLGENLHGENVVVAIDDEAGEEIGLAEDDAVGVGVVNDRLAIGYGVGDALAKQGR